MEPAADEVAFESPAHFRIYKSGRIERLNRPPVLPAGLDEATGVTSKDVVLDAGTGLSARLYLPKLQAEPSKKLPVLVYFHGGAFLIESADSATYHTYVNPLAAAAGVLAVSVSYRLAPEHPLPAAYEDSWAALQWAASAEDEWIAEHGDVARLFLAGDSAGANIVHDMLLRASGDGGGPRIEGAVMLHPWTVVRRERAHRGGARGLFGGHRWALDVRVPAGPALEGGGRGGRPGPPVPRGPTQGIRIVYVLGLAQSEFQSISFASREGRRSPRDRNVFPPSTVPRRPLGRGRHAADGRPPETRVPDAPTASQKRARAWLDACAELLNADARSTPARKGSNQ